MEFIQSPLRLLILAENKVNSVGVLPFIGAIRGIYIDNTLVADATLDAMYSTTCSNDGVSTGGLGLVSGTGKGFEVLETTPKIKYVSLNIAAATTATNPVLDTSGDAHHFGLSASFPFRIPEQGYKFEKGRSLQANTGFTLPDSFTVNVWFRVDPNITVPDTQMQYLYLKYDSGGSADKFYIGLTNTFLRIFIDGAIYDYSTTFSSNSNWRYLSVSFYKTSTSTTGVQIFLDSTKLSTQSLSAAFTDSAAYNVIVGKDLEGTIYSFEITPLLNLDLTVAPLLFSGTCTAYGSTPSCTLCPRTSTSAGTGISHCSFGTYDNNCNVCDWKCEYGTAAGANCITCASNLDGSGAAPVTCTCRNGYYNNITSCVQGDSLGGTCTGSGSTNCPTCANSAYLHGASTGVSSCPTYYTANTNLRKGELDINSLLTYVYDPTSQTNGGSSNQYWDGSACQSCHSDCLTCSAAGSSACLSCPLGRYLNSNACPVCDATYMTLGSSGQCVETGG